MSRARDLAQGPRPEAARRRVAARAESEVLVYCSLGLQGAVELVEQRLEVPPVSSPHLYLVPVQRWEAAFGRFNDALMIAEYDSLEA